MQHSHQVETLLSDCFHSSSTVAFTNSSLALQSPSAAAGPKIQRCGDGLAVLGSTVAPDDRSVGHTGLTKTYQSINHYEPSCIQGYTWQDQKSNGLSAFGGPPQSAAATDLLSVSPASASGSI